MTGFLAAELTTSKEGIIQRDLLKILDELIIHGEYRLVPEDPAISADQYRFSYKECREVAIVVNYILNSSNRTEDIGWMRKMFKRLSKTGAGRIGAICIAAEKQDGSSIIKVNYIIEGEQVLTGTTAFKNTLSAARLFLLLSNVSNTINLQALLSEALEQLDNTNLLM